MKELDRQLYNEPENVKQYWKTRLRKRLEKRWKKEAENKALLAVLAQSMPKKLS